MLNINRSTILRLFFLGIIISSLIILFLYFLIDEKKYNSIFMAYISSEKVKDCRTFEERIRVLRKFVHENVHPVSREENRLDTVGIDKLVSGVGWCDQIARVFRQLVTPQGVTNRLLFLVNKDGSSPHSIAEVWDGERWILVDSSYDLEFQNKFGKMGSMTDIRDDFSIVLNNPKVKTFAKYNSWWGDKENLTMYYRVPIYVVTKRGIGFNPFNHLPSFLTKPFIYAVQEIYFLKKKREFPNIYEAMYFKARTCHLIGRWKEAEKLYKKILNNNTNPHINDKTHFFLARLLLRQKREKESVKALSDLIENCENTEWLPFAYGLRSHVYEILGDEDKAGEDFAKFAPSPDSYF